MSNKINYKFEGKSLILTINNEEKLVEFNFPIRQVVTLENLIFVRLEPDIGSIYNENVFCVSDKGEILWQVQPISHVYDDAPITGMSVHENKLKLYSWDGVDMIINPYTGEVIKKEFSK